MDLVAVMPPDGAFGPAPETLAGDVAALTAGSLRFTILTPAAATIAVPEIFDRVDAGDLDLAIAPPAAFAVNGEPLSIGPLLVSGMPFGFTAHEFLAWYLGGGGQELVQEIYDRRSAYGNTLLLPLVVTSSEPPGFFTEPVPDDADAFDQSGITYRINMLGAKVMKEAFPNIKLASSPPGVVPVDDLCEGRIQGAELGTLSVYRTLFVERFSHEKGQNIVECGFRHLYLSSWQQLMLSNWLIINKPFFDSLDSHEQHAIRTAALAQLTRSLSTDLAAGADVAAQFAAAGATIHSSLPPAILERLREATAVVVARESSADADFAALIENMRTFARRNHAGLLYDGVAPDRRFNLLPGWQPEYGTQTH
ncbi:MAG: hypothetical protein AAF736_18975 [Pseudomonadota bacterium]